MSLTTISNLNFTLNNTGGGIPIVNTDINIFDNIDDNKDTNIYSEENMLDYCNDCQKCNKFRYDLKKRKILDENNIWRMIQIKYVEKCYPGEYIMGWVIIKGYYIPRKYTYSFYR